MTTCFMCGSVLMFVFPDSSSVSQLGVGRRMVLRCFLAPSRVEPNWVVHSLRREKRGQRERGQ